MVQAVFCTVKNTDEATKIVDRLKVNGFRARDISLLVPHKEGVKNVTVDKNSKSPEGAAVGASTGALLGGGLGWLVGIGSLAIPGVGPLIAAGPIMAALAGVAVGSALGGLSGALIGLGIPEYEASHFVEKLKSGRCLISVHAENNPEIELAKHIFKEAGAEDISTTTEMTAGRS